VPVGNGVGAALDRGDAPWARARQLRSIEGEIPSSVAICMVGRPLLSSSATASRLNSGVNSRLAFVIKHLPAPAGAYQRCPSKRGRISLTALELKEPPRRYQRQHPGELIHLDIKKLARFERMGHRITGDRRHASTGAGYDCFHVAIDDATRLAYVEVLPDETRRSTTAFLVRTPRWFRARGIRVERVMTDNGSGYVARLFRKALRLLGIRHIRTRPYTPKTNGKAERFIQTLLREWAYAIPFSTSHARAADLPRWLTWYNQQRPHGSLGRRTPAQALAGTT